MIEFLMSSKITKEQLPQLIKLSAGQFGTISQVYKKTDFRRDNFPLTISIRDGKVVGQAILVDAQSEGKEIHVFVHPSYRRLGIGQALFDRLVGQLGADELVRLLPFNASGVQFFKSCIHKNRMRDRIHGDIWDLFFEEP